MFESREIPARPFENSSAIQSSLIIPVYRNEDNVPSLLSALARISEEVQGFEAVFVVDGSPDASHAVLSHELRSAPFSWQLIELSRNFGSFAAIRQGLAFARGEIFAVMAADLQEPPELVAKFFASLRSDECDLAVGVRRKRNDPHFTRLSSGIFWRLYRRFVIPDVPVGGVDVFGCNRRFCEALLGLEERNSFLVGQLFWLGFRRMEFPYERMERKVGKSSWGFRRRLRYMLDSVFAFSDLPMTLLLWLGAVGTLVSILLSLVIIFSWLAGMIEVAGYVPLMLAVLFIGSTMILSQGILGCYLWRVSENTKKRPLSTVLSHRSSESVELRVRSYSR